MLDSINQISSDSSIFYLKTNIEVSEADTSWFQFSPYVVIPKDSVGISFQNINQTVTTQPIRNDYTGLPRIIPQKEASVFFILFAFCFVLFAIFFRSEKSARYTEMKNLFAFGKKPSSVYKNQVTTTEVWGGIYLIFQSLLIYSIFAYNFFWNQGVSEMHTPNKLLLFASIFLFILLFLLIRYLTYWIFGSVFFQSKVESWTEKYLRIVEILGLMCYFPVLFYVFIPEWRSVLFIALAIFFLIARIGVVIGMLEIFVKNRIGFLYFFVYLCAVEIMPYYLLYIGPVSLISILGNIVL